jgi:hypothetical protein
MTTALDPASDLDARAPAARTQSIRRLAVFIGKALILAAVVATGLGLGSVAGFIAGLLSGLIPFAC